MIKTSQQNAERRKQSETRQRSWRGPAYCLLPTAYDSRGFTLVETLVAITILMMAIVGPYYAIQQAVNASYTARDQLIAASLAQEGVEYIHSIRDNNYIYNSSLACQPNGCRSWLAGLDGSNGSTASAANCFTATGCMVDPTQNTAVTCAAGGCQPLYLSGTYVYNQAGSGAPTRFTRTVTLTSVSGTEVAVTVTVSWITEHTPHKVIVTEHLNDWL